LQHHLIPSFLGTEFCEENLLFYQAVEQFRSIKNPLNRGRQAIVIYRTFLGPSAEKEINVSAKHVQTIEVRTKLSF
jgi:hypothetical protein